MRCGPGRSIPSRECVFKFVCACGRLLVCVLVFWCRCARVRVRVRVGVFSRDEVQREAFIGNAPLGYHATSVLIRLLGAVQTVMSVSILYLFVRKSGPLIVRRKMAHLARKVSMVNSNRSAKLLSFLRTPLRVLAEEFQWSEQMLVRGLPGRGGSACRPTAGVGHGVVGGRRFGAPTRRQQCPQALLCLPRCPRLRFHFPVFPPRARVS
jgi:hypothetical protein